MNGVTATGLDVQARLRGKEPANAGRAMWGKTRNLKETAAAARETFGVGQIFTKEASTYRNPLEESGNQILDRGITKTALLEDGRNRVVRKDSKLVSNNDILDTWTTGYTDERRQVVQTYDAGAGEKARERNRSVVNRMPTEDLDIQA